mgnify:CR=1 FL=1
MSAAVRIASASDAPLLARLQRDCFAESWDEIVFAKLLGSATIFALMMSAPTANENDSQAFAVIQTAANESEILTLGTLPAARRAGLAHTLLKAAAAEAARRGARVMFLEVAADNDAARALYRGAGFAEVGRRKAYYARPGGAAVDALMLRASLPL